METELKWYFPKNAGGMEEGFANQGINQFKVAPYQKLAREIIQNSYDAREKNEDGTEKKVKVVFELSRLAKERVPDLDYVMKCIEASKNYFENDSRLNSFYNTAKNAYEKDYINVLKISDYNTTGLVGIDDSENRKAAWYGLIKSSGNSTKSGTTGGSYGAGKHAPFVFSSFRTIFYSTYVDGEGFGFQGKSLLCTHEIDGEKKSNVGFYGKSYDDCCMPIRDQNQIDEFYRRDKQSGTDLFIIGAKLEEDWNDMIIASVIENFWMLILEDKLEVVIKEDGQAPYSINCQNVKNIAESLGKTTPDFNAHKFMAIYFSDAEVIKGSIIDNDDVELRIGQLVDFPEKKILLMRETEMKIKIQSARKRPINYIGIFKATGKKINELLRESEPQTHDDWNADNVEDELKKKETRKAINRVIKWLNDEINKLAYVGNIKEIDAEGLDFLNIEDENEDEEVKQHNFDEFINKEKSEIEIAPKPSYAKPKVQTKNVVDEFGVGGESSNGKNSRERKNGKKPYGDGANNSGGGARMRGIELSYVKTPFDTTKGVQRIILKASEQIEKCYLTLNQFTDSDEFENIDIEYAKCGDKMLKVKGNLIEEVALSKEDNTVLEVKFKNNSRNLLEVNAYVQE